MRRRESLRQLLLPHLIEIDERLEAEMVCGDDRCAIEFPRRGERRRRGGIRWAWRIVLSVVLCGAIVSFVSAVIGPCDQADREAGAGHRRRDVVRGWPEGWPVVAEEPGALMGRTMRCVAFKLSKAQNLGQRPPIAKALADVRALALSRPVGEK